MMLCLGVVVGSGCNGTVPGRPADEPRPVEPAPAPASTERPAPPPESPKPLRHDERVAAAISFYKQVGMKSWDEPVYVAVDAQGQMVFEGTVQRDYGWEAPASTMRHWADPSGPDQMIVASVRWVPRDKRYYAEATRSYLAQWDYQLLMGAWPQAADVLGQYAGGVPDSGPEAILRTWLEQHLPGRVLDVKLARPPVGRDPQALTVTLKPGSGSGSDRLNEATLIAIFGATLGLHPTVTYAGVEDPHQVEADPYWLGGNFYDPASKDFRDWVSVDGARGRPKYLRPAPWNLAKAIQDFADGSPLLPQGFTAIVGTKYLTPTGYIRFQTVTDKLPDMEKLGQTAAAVAQLLESYPGLADASIVIKTRDLIKTRDRQLLRLHLSKPVLFATRELERQYGPLDLPTKLTQYEYELYEVIYHTGVRRPVSG